MKKKGYLFLTVALFMMTILFLQSESKAVMTSWSAEQPPEGAKGLEKTTDVAEHVGKILKNLIIKYA